MVIEQAKQELEKLETQYPNCFQSLKLDLKTFISQLEEEQEEKLSSQQRYSFPTTTASTHVSSTRKKRKKGNSDVKGTRDDDQAQSKLEISKMLHMKRFCCENGYGKRRDMRTDAAIERARVCLQKVQQLKTSFFQY
ncbi:hypothetical protein POM88_046354 [Heracleum sosnowskyi]|uniref:Uncharacterized protein n=1 Tax=Heracleum sosnowskyi TaxID=360622 RepID=A0AAD8H6S3_9APIA|nr:hypothetical protein POM88_046354 [Heracleum sosnowskyi]